jgi:hypothetical protein
VGQAKDTRAFRDRGWFIGVEVERTPFAGQETLFITRSKFLGLTKSEQPSPGAICQPHIYLCLADEDFWEMPDVISLRSLSSVKLFVGLALGAGRNVTVDVRSDDLETMRLFSVFRRGPASIQFCLLVTVVIPEPDLLGFAIKAEPEVIFSDELPTETGVYVIDSTAMHFTGWDAYKGDK